MDEVALDAELTLELELAAELELAELLGLAALGFLADLASLAWRFFFEAGLDLEDDWRVRVVLDDEA